MGRFERELDLTLSVIRRAGDEILRRYASFGRIEDAPADISTEADEASQALILDAVHQAFPGDAMCAEEASARFETRVEEGAHGARRFWVVDPIDGTRGFARKNGEFSIMIALVEDGEAVLGAVHEPVPDRLTWALRGEGCFVVRGGEGVGAKGCAVSETEGAPRVLAMSRSQGDEGERELLAGLGAEEAVRTYSAGIKLAQVARGEVDLYLGDYLTLRDWDVAAGHVLVTEAGGRVTSVDGDPIRYDGSGQSLRGRGIVASNGGVHDAALEAIADGRVTW
jgi:3'(2'), 5'-bisphosphate nucleotidase